MLYCAPSAHDTISRRYDLYCVSVLKSHNVPEHTHNKNLLTKQMKRNERQLQRISWQSIQILTFASSFFFSFSSFYSCLCESISIQNPEFVCTWHSFSEAAFNSDSFSLAAKLSMALLPTH